MKDAEPHHSAYTGNATISLLRKESRKRADRLLLRKEWENARISYSFRMGIRCRISWKVRIVRSSNPL